MSARISTFLEAPQQEVFFAYILSLRNHANAWRYHRCFFYFGTAILRGLISFLCISFYLLIFFVRTMYENDPLCRFGKISLSSHYKMPSMPCLVQLLTICKGIAEYHISQNIYNKQEDFPLILSFSQRRCYWQLLRIVDNDSIIHKFCCYIFAILLKKKESLQILWDSVKAEWECSPCSLTNSETFDKSSDIAICLIIMTLSATTSTASRANSKNSVVSDPHATPAIPAPVALLTEFKQPLMESEATEASEASGRDRSARAVPKKGFWSNLENQPEAFTRGTKMVRITKKGRKLWGTGTMMIGRSEQRSSSWRRSVTVTSRESTRFIWLCTLSVKKPQALVAGRGEERCGVESDVQGEGPERQWETRQLLILAPERAGGELSLLGFFRSWKYWIFSLGFLLSYRTSIRLLSWVSFTYSTPILL